MGVFGSVIFFIISFFLIFVFLKISISKKNFSQKFYALLAILIPVLISSFRGVGTDTANYYFSFNYYKDINLFSLYQNIGLKEYFNTFFLWISFVFNSFNLYLFMYSLFTIYFMYLSLKRYVPEYLIPFSFFVYLCMDYGQTMNIMRQSLACSIIFFSFSYIQKKKFKKFLFFLFLAVGFHFTSIIVLPFYFFINKIHYVRKRMFIITYLFLFIFLFFYKSLFSFFGSFSFLQRYISYASIDFEFNNRLFLVNFIIFGVLILYKKNIIHLNKVYGFFFHLLFFGLLLGATGYISPFIKRISIYFDQVRIPLISSLVEVYARKREGNVVSMILIFVAVAYFIVAYGILKIGMIIPFEFKIY